jgi:hypothetical protein
MPPFSERLLPGPAVPDDSLESGRQLGYGYGPITDIGESSKATKLTPSGHFSRFMF